MSGHNIPDPAELDVKYSHVSHPLLLVAEYSVWLDQLNERLGIRIWKMDVPLGGDSYQFTTSHEVHTPTQAGPYTPSAPYAATVEAALHKAIRSVSSYINDAVTQGHEPSSDWLVPNRRY